MTRSSFAVGLGLLVTITVPAPVFGQSVPRDFAPSKSLDELLSRVKTGMKKQNEEIAAREAEFRAENGKRTAMLREAQAELAREEKRSVSLEAAFTKNEKELAELETTLATRLGTMGELFGVIRQVAGDTHAHLTGSMVTAQFPDRGKFLEELATTKGLPSVGELEELWYTLQHEMTESGKVVRFEAPVVAPGGTEAPKTVIRVGVFNAVADGVYLNWEPEVRKLVVLGRQPATRYLETARALTEATTGPVRFALDPSRGAILSLLVQSPSLAERLQFGGLIGYGIIALGIAAFLVGLARLIFLSFVDMKVRRQQASDEIRENNPLGRVLAVYQKNPDLGPEALELKLDEAIIREQARIERFLWLIKVVSVVAPLMGLLGTVTGMIKTFQAITLFGTGDPKLMAGGISEALVTTMLGLITAIPLVLLHSWLSSVTRRMMDVIGEQSTGIVAKQAEEHARR